MKKIKLKIKLGIDIAMILSFLINMFTGVAVFFGLVTNGGFRQNRGFNIFNMQDLANLGIKGYFKLIHNWSGIIIIILILIHLILNWDTFWCYLKNSFLKNSFSFLKNNKYKTSQVNFENRNVVASKWIIKN